MLMRKNSVSFYRLCIQALVICSILFVGTSFSNRANATDFVVEDEVKFGRWTVQKRSSPTRGLNCRAFICNAGNCDSSAVTAQLILWGSPSDRVIDTVFSGRFTRAGVSNPRVDIGDQSFALERFKDSRFFVPKGGNSGFRQVLRAIDTMGAGRLVFRDDNNQEQIRIRNLSSVRDYFDQHCSLRF